MVEQATAEPEGAPRQSENQSSDDGGRSVGAEGFGFYSLSEMYCGAENHE